MPNPTISQIQLPNGNIYDIKDAVAREAIAGGVMFLGVTTTALTDGASTASILVGGESVAAVNGGLAVYNHKEFVYATADNKWHEFGDTTGLGDLAWKNSASGSYTPEGTVSQPTFSGSEMTATGAFTPSGTVSQPSFTGTQGNVSVSGTPAGTIAVGEGTANYTPAGSITQPTINVTPTTDTQYVADSATGGGSVTAGVAASCTLPTLSMSVSNEVLNLEWSAGSFTANTPTAVTLPTFSSKSNVTGVSATATGAAFTGTGVELTFSGSTMNATGTFTPEGTVSQPSFTGSEGSVSVTGTPEGTVSQPTFSGSAATVTVS